MLFQKLFDRTGLLDVYAIVIGHTTEWSFVKLASIMSSHRLVADNMRQVRPSAILGQDMFEWLMGRSHPGEVLEPIVTAIRDYKRSAPQR